MKNLILVVDKAGFPPTLKTGLETMFDCSVESFRDGYDAKEFTDGNVVNLAIINPYVDFGGVVNFCVDLVKNDLRSKDVPVIIYSRSGVERIQQNTKLVLGVDYKAYLRKPVTPNKLMECVRELFEEICRG